MNVVIRQANLKDADSILELVIKLALYEKKKPEDIKLTKEKIIEHGFGKKPYFNLLVAEIDKNVIGYALYFFTYAASAGSPILYIEDLFVLEDYRQKSIGTKMLTELAKIANNHGCCRMEWHVFSWNTKAINFYTLLNASLRTDLIQVRLENTALQDLLNT